MKKFGNVIWGVVLILVGLILGLNAIGVTNINIFFDGWWTLLIIIPCFVGLFKEKEKTGNLIGLFVGIILLLCIQGYLDVEMIGKLLVPAILIAIGIAVMFRSVINGKVNDEVKKLNEKQKSGNEYCATFSGQNVNFDNEEFKSASLTAVFGGIKCDLRKAIINEDVIINAEAIFGGIDIYVPENIKVKIKSTPIFGGVSDKTKSSGNDVEKVHTLYINSVAMFGGVDIK